MFAITPFESVVLTLVPLLPWALVVVALYWAVRTLLDDPALLLVGMVLPVLVALLGVVVLSWVVRLGVRHGAADADRALGGGPTPPTAPGPQAED